MEQARNQYYASLNVSPGPPTDKDYYAEPQNSGIPAPVFMDSTANSAPPGWPADTLVPPNGPPVYLPTIPSNDSVKAGYGFQDAGQLYENSQYFFHPDLTGSTTYVTNGQGAITQHVEYSPLGETFVETHTGSYVTGYLFHAKERDEETGSYDPVLSQWLSVEDPLGDDYPLDGSGYGSWRETDDDDEALSSPYMNPAAVVGSGLHAAENNRDDRGKSELARHIKTLAKKSREPINRDIVWHFILRNPSDLRTALEQYGFADRLEPFEHRGSVVIDPVLLNRRRGAVLPDGSRGSVLNPDGHGMRRGSSAVDVTVHPNADPGGAMPDQGGSPARRMTRRGSSAVDVIMHRSSTPAPGGAHQPVRPRAGAVQGGNGVR
jgi:hypothetical protein